MSSSDRVVLVTGAAKGIGLGCVEEIAREGAHVILSDIDVVEGERQSAALRQLDLSVQFELLDVTDWQNIRSVIDGISVRHGRLDALINNAGHHNGKGLRTCSLEEWDSLIDLNLKSVFLCCKAAVDLIELHAGCIVNISSCVGLRGQDQAAAYAASKAGMIGMTRSLALELAPHGVRVNCVCPSNVDTPLMKTWIATQSDPAAVRRHVEEAQPLGRLASQREIGSVVAFLAGDRSSFLTGEVIVADGGATLGYRSL